MEDIIKLGIEVLKARTDEEIQPDMYSIAAIDVNDRVFNILTDDEVGQYL
jgi:hypothetical protein